MFDFPYHLPTVQMDSSMFLFSLCVEYNCMFFSVGHTGGFPPTPHQPPHNSLIIVGGVCGINEYDSHKLQETHYTSFPP